MRRAEGVDGHKLSPEFVEFVQRIFTSGYSGRGPADPRDPEKKETGIDDGWMRLSAVKWVWWSSRSAAISIGTKRTKQSQWEQGAGFMR